MNVDHFAYRFATMCFGLGFLFLLGLYGYASIGNKDTGNLGTVLLGVGSFLSGLLIIPKRI